MASVAGGSPGLVARPSRQLAITSKPVKHWQQSAARTGQSAYSHLTSRRHYQPLRVGRDAAAGVLPLGAQIGTRRVPGRADAQREQQRSMACESEEEQARAGQGSAGAAATVR